MDFFVPGEPGTPQILGNPGGGGIPENPRLCVETARMPKVPYLHSRHTGLRVRWDKLR